MDKIKRDTSRCSNSITHYHPIDNSALCEHYVLVLWNPEECKTLGSVVSVQILSKLCQDFLNDIKDYASDQQLEMVWKLGLEQHKAFEDILSDIRNILDSTVRATNPKDLTKIQQRVLDLKKQIMESEIFIKCLVHKEMTRLRFREADNDSELLLCKTARIISQAKTMIRNKFEKTSHLLDLEFEINQNLKDLKKDTQHRDWGSQEEP